VCVSVSVRVRACVRARACVYNSELQNFSNELYKSSISQITNPHIYFFSSFPIPLLVAFFIKPKI
jgi:hypothetical protein